MAASTVKPKDDDEMWGLLREHHADLAGVKSDMAGVKRDVGALGETVSRYGAKLDEVLSAVTSHAARQGPSFRQIIESATYILAIVGALTAGITILVGNSYEGRLAESAAAVKQLEAALSVRDAEDRAELAALRIERWGAVSARLRALEEQQGWAPTIDR